MSTLNFFYWNLTIFWVYFLSGSECFYLFVLFHIRCDQVQKGLLFFFFISLEIVFNQLSKLIDIADSNLGNPNHCVPACILVLIVPTHSQLLVFPVKEFVVNSNKVCKLQLSFMKYTVYAKTLIITILLSTLISDVHKMVLLNIILLPV